MLKPRTGAIVDKRIVVYDLEWYPETYRLRLAGLYDGDTYESFTTIADLLNAMMVSENRGAYIYAHAGGLADVQFLLQEIVTSRRELSVEGSFSSSSCIMLHITDAAKHRWTLIDSLWTLRSSLKAIGESIGLEKTGDWTCGGSELVPLVREDDPQGPRRRTCGHRDKHCIFYAPMPVLRDYNRRDCEVLWLALSRLQTGLTDLGGELGPTAASCALRLFQRKFLKGEIQTPKGVNLASREAYVASRVEVFQREAGPGVSFYDVNSSFPWSMTQPFPGRPIGRERRWLEDDELALVRAIVTVPEHLYVPPLAYRARDGHIYHPTGTWEGSFFGVDLRALLACGGKIEKVKWVLRFEARHDLRDYVLAIYELRKNTKDPFLRDLYKLLMNSLYGKFAEREEKQRMLIRPAKVPKGARRVLPGVYLTDEIKKVAHAHVPASAVVVARSRQLLGDFIRSVERVWYCDCDCLATDETMPTGTELGELKLEKMVLEKATFLRPKLYAVDGDTEDSGQLSLFRGIVKAKGFPKLTKEQFDDLAHGNPIEYSRMMRLREKLGMGQLGVQECDEKGIGDFATEQRFTFDATGDGYSMGLEPSDKHVAKKLNPKTRTKRMFDANGNTRPWDVQELSLGPGASRPAKVFSSGK